LAAKDAAPRLRQIKPVVNNKHSAIKRRREPPATKATGAKGLKANKIPWMNPTIPKINPRNIAGNGKNAATPAKAAPKSGNNKTSWPTGVCVVIRSRPTSASCNPAPTTKNAAAAAAL
jgi:hypothetical protein